MSMNSKIIVQMKLQELDLNLKDFSSKTSKVSTQNVILFIREIFSVFQLSKAGFFMLY